MSLPTVLSCHILNTQPGTPALKAIAIAKMSDGRTVEVLSWFDDELTFEVDDFIGKTQAEIITMFYRRDREFLQEEYRAP